MPGFLLPLLGIGAGAAWSGGAGAAVRLFGSDTAAVLTAAAVAAAAFIAGLLREGLGARDHARPAGVRVARRLAALGLLTAAAALAGPAGGVLAWMGAGPDASLVSITLARLVTGAVLLGPPAWLAGSALRIGASLLPPGPDAAHGLAAGTAAAVLGAAAPTLAGLAVPADPARAAALAGGALLLVAAAVLARLRAAEDAAEPVTVQLPAFAAAAALGFLAAALFVLGRRLFVPAFAGELPGIPLTASVLSAAGGVGALVAAFLAQRAGAPPMAASAALAGVAAIAVLVRTADWGTLPAAFAASAQAAPDADAVIRAALGFAVPRLAPAAVLAGAAAVFLPASLPATPGARARWIASAGAGLAAGAFAGLAVARLAVAPLGLDGASGAVPVAAAALAAFALVTKANARALRMAGAAALVSGAALAERTSPPVDRRALLVDSDLAARASVTRRAQQSWLASDQEDEVLGAAILRRGLARRLLVDGRLEGTNESTLRTHAMLAHIPLLLHGSPKRMLVVGAGTGGAIAGAIAYPLERIDVFDVSRVPVRAAVRMGPVSYGAFLDGRVRVATGDPEDLLARAPRYDVIVLEAAGRWTERAIAASTREYLARVRAHLDQGGIAAGWIPESALTREGFLAALAAWADVFPQVELWAGHGGDVLVVARSAIARHDFGAVLSGYGEPVILGACEAAWIGTPDTLLGRFLVGDATVRRLVRDSVVPAKANGELARREAARRRGSPTVNPVPGLAQIRDDVLAAFTNTPVEGFAEAVARAVRASDLAREALAMELDGRVEDAVTAYREGLELNPRDGALRRSFATLRSEQGIAYGVRQQFFAAHQYMREAVETDTTYAQGFANLGLLLFQTEEFDYALACTGQATLLAPDDDLFRLQMGRIWKQRGYYDKALPYYEAARELNPENVEAAVGWLDTKLAMQGDHADLPWGLEFLHSLLAIDPDHEDVHYRISKLEDAIRRHATRAPETDDAAQHFEGDGHDHGPGGAATGGG